MNDAKEIFGEPISVYRRRNAIEDGVLVDVTGTDEFREAGFKWPVAATRTVWERYVEIPEGATCQDLKGRLWDLLWMLRCAIRASRGGREILFHLYVRNDNRRPRKVTLKAICGPGDSGEPVITVMLPEED